MPETNSWEQTLGIPGARALTVTAIENRTVVWSAQVTGNPVDDRAAPVAAAMIEAASELIRLTETDPALDDLLVVGPTTFHVLRVGGPPADGWVAHLMLDRDRANLAMARREFRDLSRTVGTLSLPENGAESPPPAVPAPPEQPPTEPAPAWDDAKLHDELPDDVERLDGMVPDDIEMPGDARQPVEIDLTGLPRRRTAPRPWSTSPAQQVADVPDWFASLEQVPFESDSRTLVRVQEGLHRLR
nr:hypothetical protein [Micromonospora sp. DSM 115978]